MLSGGRWWRTYRVSHILELETLHERFERPEGFDLADYWQTWARRFETSVYRGEAVVRLSPRALERLPFLLGPVATRAARDIAGPPDQDGWTQVVLPIESIEHARVDLLRLGADAEVVAPEELRRRMTETADALARIYRSR